MHPQFPLKVLEIRIDPRRCPINRRRNLVRRGHRYFTTTG